jgi:D-alanyl-lipoteichoic acid acyltransferase DltB (MBOAT superfamily)
MSFTEVEFFFFLPVVLLVHWMLPRSRRFQNVFLLAVSLLFYAAWNYRFLALVVTGAVVDFIAIQQMEGDPDRDGRLNARRRVALTVSLVFSLGALGFFKYESFFAQSLNTVFERLGARGQLPVLHLLLPLGISFFTLQRIGYVLDVYWGRIKPTKSVLDFLLFSCFFPQLAAGPISRGSELMVQLERPRRLTAEMLADGSVAFLLGFTMKAWAADVIGLSWVDPVFAASARFGRTAHIAAALGYPLQVFGDFAGYSLMAIGVARLFAITLPVNFNYPFLSKSLPELWRRWHISLNRWLFDYIFTPMTTSRGWFRGRLDVAMLVTFLASGLWHGAHWTFVTWGALHGIGMIVQRNWDERYRKLCRTNRQYVRLRQTKIYAILGWTITISFFIFSLIPFRASSLVASGSFVRELLFVPGVESVGFSPEHLLCVLFIVGYHLLELPLLRRIRDWFLALPAPVRGIVYGVFIVWLALKVPASAGTFIYQQF